MNMMYKASVAFTCADGGMNTNEIFLNAVWNQFGNQKDARMHEYLIPDGERDFGCDSASRSPPAL